LNRPDRTRLTRERIVEVAIELADQHGPAALTMRRLGNLLDVEAMSLYHYVNGREDLLEAMVDLVVDGVRIPSHEPLGPADGWQAFLQDVAHQIRGLAQTHPNLFPLIATRPPSAPWLRPPLRSLRVVDEFLQGLGRRGLDDEQAVHVYKVFAGFLLGHLLLEVSEAGASTAPVDEALDEGAAPVPNRVQRLSLEDYPTIGRLEHRLRVHDAAADFEAALETLLDRLDGELSR
jgi:TetR/AcrR family transcriptional regulator, tetracycline repressor protein